MVGCLHGWFLEEGWGWFQGFLAGFPVLSLYGWREPGSDQELRQEFGWVLADKFRSLLLGETTSCACAAKSSLFTHSLQKEWSVQTGPGHWSCFHCFVFSTLLLWSFLFYCRIFLTLTFFLDPKLIQNHKADLMSLVIEQPEMSCAYMARSNFALSHCHQLFFLTSQ